MNGRQLKKILMDHGWELDRIRGSHHILVKEGRGSIPVPIHGNKDLPHGLINAIVKQAGLSKDDLK